MAATFDTVLESALLLSVEDRSRIAARLIESVDAADDTELSSAWCSEIDRRIEAARSGASRRTPHAEVMNEARSLLAQL